MSPRVAVIGPARAGKSTFAGYLAGYLGTVAVDTSAWLVRVETARIARLAEIDSMPGDWTDYWDSARRRPRRELLIALGDAVCDLQPDFLIQRALECGRVVVGVRRVEEFNALPAGTTTVYVDRPGESEADNFDIPPGDAGIVVQNDRGLAELRLEAAAVAASL